MLHLSLMGTPPEVLAGYMDGVEYAAGGDVSLPAERCSSCSAWTDPGWVPRVECPTCRYLAGWSRGAMAASGWFDSEGES